MLNVRIIIKIVFPFNNNEDNGGDYEGGCNEREFMEPMLTVRKGCDIMKAS